MHPPPVYFSNLQQAATARHNNLVDKRIQEFKELAATDQQAMNYLLADIWKLQAYELDWPGKPATWGKLEAFVKQGWDCETRLRQFRSQYIFHAEMMHALYPSRGSEGFEFDKLVSPNFGLPDNRTWTPGGLDLNKPADKPIPPGLKDFMSHARTGMELRLNDLIATRDSIMTYLAAHLMDD